MKIEEKGWIAISSDQKLTKVSSQKLFGWQRSEEVATTFPLIKILKTDSPAGH